MFHFVGFFDLHILSCLPVKHHVFRPNNQQCGQQRSSPNDLNQIFPSSMFFYHMVDLSLTGLARTRFLLLFHLDLCLGRKESVKSAGLARHLTNLDQPGKHKNVAKSQVPSRLSLLSRSSLLPLSLRQSSVAFPLGKSESQRQDKCK